MYDKVEFQLMKNSVTAIHHSQSFSGSSFKIQCVSVVSVVHHIDVSNLLEGVVMQGETCPALQQYQSLDFHGVSTILVSQHSWRFHNISLSTFMWFFPQ